MPKSITRASPLCIQRRNQRRLDCGDRPNDGPSLMWWQKIRLLGLDVFAQVVCADVGGVDGASIIRGDTGCRCPVDHLIQVRGIRNKSLQRAVFGIANHDAPQFAFLGFRIRK